jgi:hypothetical protein
MPVVIFRRVECSWLFCTLGAGAVFSPLHIRYVGAYTGPSDATNSIYSFIPFCGVMNRCGEITVPSVCMLYTLCLVW